MSAAAEALAHLGAVKARLRTQRRLAAALCKLSDYDADDAALYPAGYSRNVVAVVLSCVYLTQHGVCDHRCHYCSVFFESHPRTNETFKHYPCFRRLAEQLKVELLHLGSGVGKLACGSKGLRRDVCVSEAAAVGRDRNVKQACLGLARLGAEKLYKLKHQLTAGCLGRAEQ